MSLYLYLLILIVCVSVVVRHRNALIYRFTYLKILLYITLVVEFTGLYYLKIRHETATWIFHLYQPLEYILLALYFLAIIKNQLARKIIVISIPLVLVSNFLNSILIQKIHESPTYLFLTAAFFFCIWSIIYFVELLNSRNDGILWKNPDFWITTGILFFYAGCFFQMGLSNLIKRENLSLATNLYIINHLLNIILYSSFTYGFLCKIKYQNQQ